MKKRIIKPISVIILTIILWFAPCAPSFAQSGDIVGTVMEVETDVVAYSEKDTSSSVVVKFSPGDYIFILGQEGNWIKIFYQGKNAYVPTDYTGTGASNATDVSEEATEAIGTTLETEGLLSEGSGNTQSLSVDQDIVSANDVKASFLSDVDNSGLDEEFEKQWEEEVAYVDAIEEQSERERRSDVWRTIIIIVVALIIAVGVLPIILPKMKPIVGEHSNESRNNGRRKRKSNRHSKE